MGTAVMIMAWKCGAFFGATGDTAVMPCDGLAVGYRTMRCLVCGATGDTPRRHYMRAAMMVEQMVRRSNSDLPPPILELPPAGAGKAARCRDR